MIENMLSTLWRKLTERHRGPFKKYVSSWYTGDWYMYLCRLSRAGVVPSNVRMSAPSNPSPAEGEVAFNHYIMGPPFLGDGSGRIDGLIPAIRIGDLVGLYKVVRGPYHQGGSDRLSWDDGRIVELKFVKKVPASRLPKFAD